MAEILLYHKLLEFPLFLGMKHKDIMELVAHTRFGFMKEDANKTIVEADSPCDGIIMLVNGQIESITASADKNFMVEEVFNSPFTLQPENIFGMTQRYTSTFRTSTKSHFITISKQELCILIDKFDTIKFNYLNILAALVQKKQRATWLPSGTDTRSHIITFLTSHCIRPSGHKVYHILMNRLAEEVNTSRLEVSRELNKMQEEGLVTLARGRITIPFLERFVTL